MIFNTSSSQHFQVGIVVGGVSDCGDKYIPAYYTRLNHPEIAGFVQSPENYFSRGINITYILVLKLAKLNVLKSNE